MNLSPSPQEIRSRIVKGVREHLRIDASMGGADDECARAVTFTAAQVAIQVITAVLPETMEWNGQQTRHFLTECGFSEDFAKSLVSDRDPWGIY